MAFPETWMNELMNKNEIVSVISEYTHLSPKGGRMWGLCPFHPERTASFSVSPDKQLFHCFSCKAGGSVIQFVMQAENLSYPDAVRFLAQRVGMDLPDEVNDAKLRADKALRDRLYDANKAAAKFYCEMLLGEQGAKARSYLLNRGIDGRTAVRFGLGYSPPDWDALFVHLTGLGFTRGELIKAGLCIKGRQDENKTFDFFHDRLMFPVINDRGRVLAFGGRTLDKDGEPKYMNTGDTLIYNKRHNVYAINMMKGKKLDELIMCEGYMDVISLHQHGIDNAVASLGTALTSQQAKLIGRFAARAVYAYDGDAAGQKAMLRGVDVLSECSVEPRVMVIPGGLDPDEYIRKYGRDAFLALKDSTITAVQFKLNYIEGETGLSTPDGRQKYATRACTLLSRLEPVERDRYIRVVSERSGIGVDVIREQCGIASVNIAEKEPQRLVSNGYKRQHDFDRRVKTEIMLAACMLRSAQTRDEITRLSGYSDELFTEPGLRALIARLTGAKRDGGEAELRLILSELEDESSDAAGGAASQAEEIANPVETARDCINALVLETCEARMLALSERIRGESDQAKRGELLAEQMQLLNTIRALKNA
ncbi:MAG: DNA primase [Clostridia bacterium]|nr:DNA primase [Clostridia bacterium]